MFYVRIRLGAVYRYVFNFKVKTFLAFKWVWVLNDFSLPKLFSFKTSSSIQNELVRACREGNA